MAWAAAKPIILNLKRSVGQREGCACGGAGKGSLLHIHVPPQACHSRCSVIHPVGDHNHQAIFFKIRCLLLEWSGQLIF
ncbi:MAG: hypothetical protein P8179_17310 [Candidatus Thiodiazotropha sp.]